MDLIILTLIILQQIILLTHKPDGRTGITTASAEGWWVWFCCFSDTAANAMGDNLDGQME